MKQVCIIGAGSSGIAAAKALKENNISFDCYEKGSDIGGNWRYNNDNGMSSAYRSLHINTNRKVMAYSDYPMPSDYPMFPHHSNIIEYFENYVDNFKIRENIHFKTAVKEVKRNADGTYKIILENGQSADYQQVIVANGHHWNPRFPEPAFAGTFSGEVLHSHDYREPEQIFKKDLLIIGIGNSAVDIACEAARQCTGNKVVISTRSRAYIVPNWLWSLPYDNLANPMTAKLPLWLQRFLIKITLWLAHGNQEDFGVPKPDRPPLGEHPTVSQDILNMAGRGLVKFKPNIKEFRGKTVVFEDGTEQDFDMIVYATGYKVSFPFFKEGFFNVENTNDLQLYRRVVHPDFKGLYFLGLLQPLGAIMPLAEIQSKWIAKLIKNECKLPDAATMQKEIIQQKAELSARYKQTPRHTLQVDFFPYKESIEKEMKRITSQ
jgi:dimethylaniline monooxygenase (N-oxide forming)